MNHTEESIKNGWQRKVLSNLVLAKEVASLPKLLAGIGNVPALKGLESESLPRKPAQVCEVCLRTRAGL